MAWPHHSKIGGSEMTYGTDEEKRIAAKLQLQVDLFLKKKTGKVRFIHQASNGQNLIVVRKVHQNIK